MICNIPQDKKQNAVSVYLEKTHGFRLHNLLPYLNNQVNLFKQKFNQRDVTTKKRRRKERQK